MDTLAGAASTLDTRALTSDPRLAAVRKQIADGFREAGTTLVQDWTDRIGELGLLGSLSPNERRTQGAALLNLYVDGLDNESYEGVRGYLRNLSLFVVPSGAHPQEVVGIVMVMREVLARWLVQKHGSEFGDLSRVLDAFRPIANNVAMTVASAFIEERERMIQEQQAAIRELSTPVLRVRDRLLVLPIVGLVDPPRARQLTRQLLMGIRNHRAKVAVIDITGVPVLDAAVANTLVQSVESARLLGATVIISGVSAEISLQLVNIGVDLSSLKTVGDLQGGMEEAERLLGFRMVRLEREGAGKPNGG
ncbi:MAG: STAS domain-containing protein [Chloroflexi bacterium]|nr:STAS domain-containing protein [Chloroflexota bacterium]